MGTKNFAEDKRFAPKIWSFGKLFALGKMKGKQRECGHTPQKLRF